uniref:Putative secreted peptide n=1 Tax=Anopheles braziliensis TaxID=58242 RepID=A0A2M3ZNJ2_9DIPT
MCVLTCSVFHSLPICYSFFLHLLVACMLPSNETISFAPFPSLHHCTTTGTIAGTDERPAPDEYSGDSGSGATTAIPAFSIVLSITLFLATLTMWRN